MSFADAINAYVAKLKTYVPTSATTLLGKTPVQAVRDVTTAADVGLGNVANQPPLTSGQNELTHPNSYATPLSAKAIMEKKVREAIGQAEPRTILFGNDVGGPAFGASMVAASVVESLAEFNAAKSAEANWGEVFYEWQAISRGNVNAATAATVGYSDQSSPSEAASFSYDEANDRISSSVDSRTLVGFVSSDKYTDYVFDVTLKSDSNWQNDFIGLILGYVKDADGTTHTLTVIWNPRPAFGASNPLAVHVDLLTVGSKVIKQEHNGLHWATGQPGNEAFSSPGQNPWTVSPWGVNPNGVRMQITRSGNDFNIKTTDYNGTVFVPTAEIDFNLNDYPETTRFIPANQIGYFAVSQDLVDWQTTSRPGLRRPIVDLTGGKNESSEWDGSAWVVTSADSGNWRLPMGRVIRNPDTGRMYLNSQDHGLIKF